MNDPIWDRVGELLKGYPPEFNAVAVYDLVRDAWKMGLDVVKAPEGSDLYGQHCLYLYNATRNVASEQNAAGMQQASAEGGP